VIPRRSFRNLGLCLAALNLLGGTCSGAAQPTAASTAHLYEHRVQSVRSVPGLVAFWDFVRRDDGSGRFLAHTAPGDVHRYLLEPRNISRDFWHEGPAATLADFPLLGRGPFGQAVEFKAPATESLLPVLLVPRADFHGTPLDLKGPGQSVSLLVWLIYRAGTHAIAGIWHEGTLAPPRGSAAPAVVRETGRRQFALFAGLGANAGAIGAHISENGLGSFGDLYARHLGVTREKLPVAAAAATPAELDAAWSVAGLVFDAEKKSVTAYLNGIATESWIEAPATTRFYRSTAHAWQQARLAQIPGLQPGEDPAFPRDQFYTPPEAQPLAESVVAETEDERTVLRTYEFTKVRVTLRRDATGTFNPVVAAELTALKANPYWFGRDLYAPGTPEEGAPFTVGRVIHSNRLSVFAAHIGGVAVFARALGVVEMQALAALGRTPAAAGQAPEMVRLADLLKSSQPP